MMRRHGGRRIACCCGVNVGVGRVVELLYYLWVVTVPYLCVATQKQQSKYKMMILPKVTLGEINNVKSFYA